MAAAPDYRAYCLAVMFGQSAMRSWQGIDLADPEQLMRHRFLLQMQAWVFSVTTALSRIDNSIGVFLST